MNDCPYTGKPCAEAPDEDRDAVCDWASLSIENHDYGICRLTGNYIGEGGEDIWDALS